MKIGGKFTWNERSGIYLTVVVVKELYKTRLKLVLPSRRVLQLLGV